MRITLAYPLGPHQPDTTIDLDDDLARRLVRDGRARTADTPAEVPQTPPRRSSKTKPDPVRAEPEPMEH